MSVNWSSGEPFSVHVIFVIAILKAGETAVNAAVPPTYTAVSPVNVTPINIIIYVLITCKSITNYESILYSLHIRITLASIPNFSYHVIGCLFFIFYFYIIVRIVLWVGLRQHYHMD